MAFWGVEVKPGKPYTHRYESTRGRLRISQATLGNGNSTKRSILQCNVGNKSPVLLCSLLPEKAESGSLGLEFEEDVDVIFSVVGPRSIHLTGYYPRPSSSGNGDETDSYGEDIAEMDSESGSHGSEDEYESDFIDDGDVQMLPPSPRCNNGVIIEEIVDDEKPTNRNSNHRRLKIRNQISDSEDDVGSPQQIVANHNSFPVIESEDEDGFPISFSLQNKPGEKDTGEGEKPVVNTSEDRKRKIESRGQDSGSESSRKTYRQCHLSVPAVEICGKSNRKSKKKKKENDVKPLVTQTDLSEGKTEERVNQCQNEGADDGMDDVNIQSVVGQIYTDEVLASRCDVDRAERSGKLKKKKKEKVKKGEISHTGVELSTEKTEARANGDQNQSIHFNKEASTNNMDSVQPVREEQERVPDGKDTTSASSVPSGGALESSQKLNKKNKKNKKRRTKEEITPGENMHPKSEEKVLIDEMYQDPSVTVTALPNNESPNIGVDSPAVDTHCEVKKKKKKKNKTHENSSIAKEHGNMVDAEGKPRLAFGTTELKDEARPVKPRTFSNGLAIEELSMGKPDGKRASPGNKATKWRNR